MPYRSASVCKMIPKLIRLGHKFFFTDPFGAFVEKKGVSFG